MIEFVPIGGLRELGKRAELSHFNMKTEDYNSVEKLIASIFYRLATDDKCPGIVVRLPKKGDEVIEGITYVENVSQQVVCNIASEMFSAAAERFGTKEILMCKCGATMLFLKAKFVKGEWCGFQKYVSGVDGVSIPH